MKSATSRLKSSQSCYVDGRSPRISQRSVLPPERLPIHIPPLRERKEDIPVLVRYFVHKFARQMQKDIETIPAATMKTLTNWEWPGNIRELENFVERTVILTRGAT
jgi:transcriptional regulator with GAF, ATPase, and Fis domain